VLYRIEASQHLRFERQNLYDFVTRKEGRAETERLTKIMNRQRRILELVRPRGQESK